MKSKSAEEVFFFLRKWRYIVETIWWAVLKIWYTIHQIYSFIWFFHCLITFFFFLLNFLLFQHHFYKLSFFMTHSGIHLFPITLLRNLRHLFVTSGKTDSKNSLLFLQLQLKKKKNIYRFFFSAKICNSIKTRQFALNSQTKHEVLLSFVA